MVEVVSAPLPPAFNRTALVICGTIAFCFVVSALAYLQVRNISTQALTAFLMQVPTTIGAVLAVFYSKRADGRGQQIQQNVNGHLAHQTEVANLALAELHPRTAARVIDTAHANAPDVAGTSPPDEPRP